MLRQWAGGAKAQNLHTYWTIMTKVADSTSHFHSPACFASIGSAKVASLTLCPSKVPYQSPLSPKRSIGFPSFDALHWKMSEYGRLCFDLTIQPLQRMLTMIFHCKAGQKRSTEGAGRLHRRLKDVFQCLLKHHKPALKYARGGAALPCQAPCRERGLILTLLRNSPLG